MPHFQLFDLIKWLHFACFIIAGGGAVVAVLLSGMEDERDEVRGLSAMLWKKVVAWGFRLALLTGIGLLLLKMDRGDHPFDAYYLHVKLTLVALLLVMSELSAKSLARLKRGAPLVAVLTFLLVTFVSVNKNAFGYRARTLPAPAEVSPAPAP